MLKSRLYTGLSLIIVMFLIGGCFVDKPEMPSWTTTWDIPLTNRIYTVEDIVDQLDSDQIITDSLGNTSFSIIQDIDTVTIGDSLTTDPVSQAYSDSLGIVDIDTPVVAPLQLLYEDLGLPGHVDRIPFDTTFAGMTGFGTITTFDWAEIHHGIVEITVTNDLGIDIDSFTITLFNTSDLQTPLGIAVFENGIQDNQSLARQIDLSGVYVENALTIGSFGVVPAQDVNQPVSGLTISAAFPIGLSVTRAYTEIPAYTNDIGQTVNLNDRSVVYEARIQNGTIELQVINGTAMPMNVSLSIPNFEFDDAPLTISDSVLGNNTLNRSIDLAGFSFYPEGTSAPQTIEVNVQASTPGTAPDKYLIDCSDPIDVSAELSSIAFASVLGQIEPTEITINPMVEPVEMPEGFENAHLPQAGLRLFLYNNGTADIYVDLLLENQDGSENVAVQDTIRGKADSSDLPRETEINIPTFTLDDFLDPVPLEIQISGIAVLNPANLDSVRVNRDDFICGQFEIYSPLTFVLADTAEIDLEITDAEIAGEDTPDFEQTFKNAFIHAEFVSHLPVGARFEIYIGTLNNDSIYTDTNSIVVGPFTLESAATDGDGFAIDTVLSVFDDSLTLSEISVFENHLVYIAPRVHLLPTDANGSIIQSSDYVNIRAMAQVQINAGEHLWDGNNSN